MASSNKSRKKRLAISCTECRQRKLKCDRKIPGCSACVKRGLPPDRCLFGDERDAETPEERAVRQAKMDAASMKRAKKRRAQAAAKKAAAAALAGGEQGVAGISAGATPAGSASPAGGIEDGTNGKKRKLSDMSKPRKSEGSDSDEVVDDGDDSDDSGDDSDEDDDDDDDEEEEEDELIHDVRDEPSAAKRARSGTPNLESSRPGSSPALTGVGVASPSQELQRSLSYGTAGVTVSTPTLSGPLPSAPEHDLAALRTAAAAAVAAAAATVSPNGGGASPGSLPSTSSAYLHAAATALAHPSRSAQNALQARSNAFAAHAQAQAQQLASSNNAHGIAALVAAISSNAHSAALGHANGHASAHGSSGTGSVELGAERPGMSPNSSAAMASLGRPASAGLGAGTSSMRATMSPDVSLTTAPTFTMPSAASSSPAATGTTRAPSGAATPQRTENRAPHQQQQKQPAENDELMDTLSSSDTTNAALGLQRLYESAETLSMMNRSGRNSATGTPAHVKVEPNDAATSNGGGGGSSSHVSPDPTMSVSSSVRGRSAPPKTDAAWRSNANRSVQAAISASPLRLGSQHPIAVISAEMLRRDSFVEMSAKSRALALLPNKLQTTHLIQMYLDELGVVIPFVRPDFVMKELDLLYESFEVRPASKDSNGSINGTPLMVESKSKEEQQQQQEQQQPPQEQSAASMVNPTVGTGPGAGLPHPRLTFLAYCLFALGSIAELLPPTYLITQGIVRTVDQVSQTLHDWQETAIGCIDAAELAANPSLEGVQAALVAVIALAHRFRHKDLIRLLDTATRAARRLGLDRLGSSDQNIRSGPNPSMKIERRTLQHWWVDPEVEMSSANLEIGRAVWSGLLMADWSHCGLNGSYNIHPLSYTTCPPIAPAQPDFSQPHDAWLGLLETADIARRWLDLNKTHEMMGTTVEYSAVLNLDDELSAILTRRTWTDKDADLTFGQPFLAESDEIKRLRRQAALIRASVHHRTLKLHRPFMSSGYKNPEQHRASVKRSLESANALVDEARTMSDRGWLSSRDRIQRYYLFQACLAMITDLWYRPRPIFPASLGNAIDGKEALASDNEETRKIQSNLDFIIDKLRDDGQAPEGSVLQGASSNLERLLAATIQHGIAQRQQEQQTLAQAAGRRGADWPSSINALGAVKSEDGLPDAYLSSESMMPPPTSSLATIGGAAEGMVDLLDAQLRRLAEMTPQNSLMNPLMTTDPFGFGGTSSSGSDLGVTGNSGTGNASSSYGGGGAGAGGLHDLGSLLSTGPDWDRAWTDLFETLEGDATEMVS